MTAENGAGDGVEKGAEGDSETFESAESVAPEGIRRETRKEARKETRKEPRKETPGESGQEPGREIGNEAPTEAENGPGSGDGDAADGSGAAPPDPAKQRRLRIALAAGAAAVAAAVIAFAAVASTGGDDGTGTGTADGGGSRQADTADGPDDADGGAAPPAAGQAAVHQDEVLVTTDWLEENLDNPDVVIIEVSENRPGSGLTPYEEGHVPGAVEFVWTEHFVQQETRDIATQAEFTETGRAAGIDNDSTVVLYGDANNWFAAWGSWVFKVYGAEDVRLLDGGRVKWEAEGRPLDNVAPTPASGDFQAAEPNLDIRAFRDEVLPSAEAASPEAAPAALVDIRGPQEYNGEIGVAEGFEGEAAVKLGHIPNAVNVPWGSIVDEDGTYLPADEIREVYARAGVDGSKPVVVYCRIGERASHTWYALSQILGYDVKLYDGSWTEWGNSVNVPVRNNSPEERSGLWS